MRAARIATLMLLTAAVGLGFGTAAFAFHRGGVAECVGCHSMHGAASSSFLTAGSDASSTCLNCHEGTPGSYHISTPAASLGPGIAPTQLTPGGDFSWLKKTYTWTVRGEFTAEAGETHGHNIVAADFDYSRDLENTTAPGGTWSSENLSCISCHDPHGKYRRIGGDTAYTIATSGAPIINSGSYHNSPVPTATEAVGVYRLLGGNGYKYDKTLNLTFGDNPPAASVNSSYNRTEANTQTRVAYGTGMADWCSTCHPNMHDGGPNDHPVNQTMSSAIRTTYATYRKSGQATPGTNADAFLSLVPYEEGNGDYAVLKTHAKIDNSFLEGPQVLGGSVSCISCHRAHASGFEYAMRWNPEAEFLTEAGKWPGTDNGSSAQFARGRSEAEMQQAYYGRNANLFATYQRSLCNKCHAQD